jgi:hypothetical protein
MAKDKAKISDFRVQEKNANKHTVRGVGMLNHAIANEGWISAITVTADGESIDGSARLEAAYERFGEDVEPIIVRSKGDRPIIHIREDLPDASDPRAKKLSIYANRVAEVDLDYDLEVLAELHEEVDLSEMFFADEIEALMGKEKPPSDSEWNNALGDLPSGDKEPFQQMTFTLHDEQVEQVKAAMEVSKKMGGFDSPNQNSNGNALARICEIFLTQNG